MRTRKQSAGFTLVELIIVIIILGILAVLAIPQFSASTTDAVRATRAANLAAIQKAIQFYKLDHDQKFPTERIAQQLSLYSKGNGDTSATKGPPYNFGPYLQQIPPNPSATGTVDADAFTVVDDNGPLAPDTTPTTGWKYNKTTGEVIPNVL